MLSKQRLIALLLAASFFSGCTLRVNEPAPEPLSIHLNSSVNNGCLSEAPLVLQKFFQGEASEKETAGLWDCLIRSFELFRENTRGSQGNDYLATELASFIEYYFLNKDPNNISRRISPSLLSELMLLKTVVLGGSTERVTAQELKATVEIFKILRTETVRLRPYMPLTYESLKTRSPEEFEQALGVFESATQSIARTFERNVRSYSLKNLEKTLEELDKLLGGEDIATTEWLRTAKRYMKLFRAAKSVLIAPPADEISVNDWKHVLYIVPRYYTTLLRGIRFFQQEKDFTQGPGLDRLTDLFVLAHQLITRTVSYHPGRLLTFDEIDLLLTEFENLEILPLPAGHIKDAFKAAFRKMLADPPVGQGESPEQRGITLFHMRILEEQFFLWSEAQYYLQELYRTKAGGFTGPGLSADEITRVPLEEALSWTRFKSEVSAEAITSLKELPATLRPLFPEESPVMLLTGRASPTHSFHNISHMNWMRAVTRLVIRGYALDPQRSQNMTGINKDEITSFYRDLYPLAVELGLLARSSSLNAAAQRFLEADLFSFSGNGDDLLSPYEGIELLSLAVSTVKKGKETHKQIIAVCGSAGEDADGVATAPLACFRNEFLTNIGKYLSHTRNFAAFIAGLPNRLEAEPSERSLPQEIMSLLANPADALAKEEEKELASLSPRQRVVRYFEKIIRGYQPKDNRPVELTHTQSYTLMSYYVEALFEKFDIDGSGTINPDEAARAYPTFQAFLTREALKQGVRNPNDVEVLFHFIMDFGKIPESKWEKAVFLYRKLFHRRPWYETDRAKILRIFSALLTSSKS